MILTFVHDDRVRVFFLPSRREYYLIKEDGKDIVEREKRKKKEKRRIKGRGKVSIVEQVTY